MVGVAVVMNSMVGVAVVVGIVGGVGEETSRGGSEGAPGTPAPCGSAGLAKPACRHQRVGEVDAHSLVE